MRRAIAPPVSLALAVPFPLKVMAFCLLWASAFSVAKLAMADCPPLTLLTIRFLLAGVVMLGAAVLHGTSLRLSRRDLALFAVLGIANQAVYLGIGYLGLRTISSGLSALMISANPVLTAALAAAFLGERMTWRKATGLLLGVGGVAFVIESRLVGGVEQPAGIMFTIVALFSLVAGTILFKRFTPSEGLWVGNGVQSLSAGLALLPFSFSLESVGDITPSWRLFAALAYLILLVSVFCISAVVPDAHGVGGDGGKLLSLLDAAARNALRMAPARRAGRAHGFRRCGAGRTRHISRHAQADNKCLVRPQSRSRKPVCCRELETAGLIEIVREGKWSANA